MKKIPIHNFLKDDETSIPFQLIQLTKEGSYDTSVPHRHNYYEVFIFKRGGGTHIIDFNSFTIEDNSVHFVSPGQVHNVNRHENSSGYVLLFSRDFYSVDNEKLNQFPFLNNNTNTPILNLKSTPFKILKNLICTIKNEQERKDSLSEDLIKSNLNSFLTYCLRFYNEVNENSNFINDSLSFRFKKMIENNYLKLHLVADYAKMLNVSEKQLYNATRKDLGLTPKDLIYERIIIEAKRLVLFTNHTFQEIACFLNYSDASHFAKFFKNKTGQSLSNFRDRGDMYQ